MKAQEFHRLSIVTIALSPIISATIAIECLRRSNLRGVVHFVAKCREEGVDCTAVSQILMRSGTDTGQSYAKEILSMSSSV